MPVVDLCMGIARIVGGTVLGLGLIGASYTDVGRQDISERDGSGDIVTAGELEVFDTQLGDCLTDAANGSIQSVQGVPCSTPHDAEVYHGFELPDGTYPGDASIIDSAFDGCSEAFEPFVGHGYETSIYDLGYLYPSFESWNDHDDREVLCLLDNYDGAKKIGTAENTGI